MYKRQHDGNPTITLSWPHAQTIARVELAFDVDFDHPMELSLIHISEPTRPY